MVPAALKIYIPIQAQLTITADCQQPSILLSTLKTCTYFLAICLTSLLTMVSENALAQQYLEKKISINFTNESIDKVLAKISDLGGFSFSYSPDVINVRGTVTIQASNQSIREILTDMFKGKVSFKERKRYIILQKSEAPPENKAPENFQLNGYIIDGRTGEKLANASIYESVTLASTVSNQYGYYRIRLPTTPVTMRLEVRKEDYVGKSITVSARKDAYLPIQLNPDIDHSIAALSPRPAGKIDTSIPKVELPGEIILPKVTIQDTVASSPAPAKYDRFKKTYQKVQSDLISAFASASQAINTRNITDSLHRPFQASLLPFLGTNHQLSGNIINDVSVNFIAGYSKGVDKFEIGAVANVVRADVKGFQLAGVSNIVGNNVKGFQYANVVNITLGSLEGFQGSHFINYTHGNVKGLQIAGVGNVAASTLNGLQLSSGYNYARNVRSGRQIGFINYADSSATVPFGLFSYVRQNGYRRYEFSVNEFNYLNFSFKTGVSRFYNIFTLGFSGALANKPLATIGYGFGTAQKLGRGWTANADATGNLVLIKGQRTDEIPAGLFRLDVSIEKKLGKRFALFAGPSLNLLATDYDGVINTDKGICPIRLGNTPDGLKTSYGWVGFQAGFRFCSPI